MKKLENMYQIIEQTHEEEIKMYSKLTKKKLIEMLIEANKFLQLKPIHFVNDGFYFEKQTYSQICSCNPANGGSGLCGCTIGNTIIKQKFK